MKIGIITFHWGTNYGAILQAYALQTYLKNIGHEVFIINYRPKRLQKTFLKIFLTPRFYLYPKRIKEYFKELTLKKFREEYLNQSIIYNSLQELKDNPPPYDVYICGSDQIWNPFFTTRGEGTSTTSYFLDFGEKHIKKIAYAISFGTDEYPMEAFNIAKKYISYFNAISVRENSGIQIVSKLGFNNPVLLPDPTLLLKADDYFFGESKNSQKNAEVFIYFLRNEEKKIKFILNILKQHFRINSTNKTINNLTVEDWIIGVKSSKFVLTNSFHGMVFSIIFHVPFAVVLSTGSAKSMNDRFITLLSFLSLEDRMILDTEQNKIEELINRNIDWDYVEVKINELRIKSTLFFNSYIK